MRCAVMTLMLIVFASTTDVAGTIPPALGDRVRATARYPLDARPESLQVVHGFWLGLSEDRSLKLRAVARPETLSLPLADMTRLEVLGTRGHAKQGAVIGTLVGGTAGVVVGFATSVPGLIFGGSTNEANERTVLYGAMGAAAGALAGGLVGHAFKSERWEPVPMGSLHGSIGPHEAGLQVRMGLRVGF